MNYIKINKLITKPLYRQLSESVEQAIIKKELRDGDKLPPERDICRVFDVSSKVVRRAFDELSRKGLVEGVTGRGTFVKVRIQIRSKLSNYHKISEWLQQQGYEVRLNTTFVTTIHANEALISPLLDLPKEEYVMIRRLYKVNQAPYLSRIIYIPTRRIAAPDSQMDSKLDCMKLIERLTAQPAWTIESDVHVFGAYSNEAIFLELENSDSIHFFMSSVWDNDHHLLAIMHSYFNGKLVEWSVSDDDELSV
jgi:DNA-binding GntR family transcriptional regulator